MTGGVAILNLGGPVMQHFTQNASSVLHFLTWIITSHKQFQAHSLQPELLAFIFFSPPLFLMVGVLLMCQPSNSPPRFILLNCSISDFPPLLPPFRPLSLLVLHHQGEELPCKHPSPQCCLHPSPSIFNIPTFFGVLLYSSVGMSKTSDVPPYSSFP